MYVPDMKVDLRQSQPLTQQHSPFICAYVFGKKKKKKVWMGGNIPKFTFLKLHNVALWHSYCIYYTFHFKTSSPLNPLQCA